MLNALGYEIGSGRDEQMMIVAADVAGRPVRVDEVLRGAACRCTCLKCGTPVVARQGELKHWSFAHVSNDKCNGAETQSHVFAKSVIERAGGLHLPSTEVWGKVDEHLQRLDIEVEPWLNGFRPDILGTWKGVSLAIEVKVSHGCDVVKIDKYRGADLSVIEIDLGPFRFRSDRDLETAVLRSAPRRWLYRRGGRRIPVRPAAAGHLESGRSGFRRPAHVPVWEWENMEPLQRVEAVWPADAEKRRLAAKHGSRGKGR